MKNIKQRKNMELMLVNIESINTFKEQIVEENNKLIDILTKMYDEKKCRCLI